MEDTFIVSCGNPADGFAFTGPFETIEAATEWAEDNLFNESDGWNVLRLNAVRKEH